MTWYVPIIPWLQQLDTALAIFASFLPVQKVKIREHFGVVHAGGSATEEDVAEARLAEVRAAAAGVAGVTDAMLAAAALSSRDIDILLLSAPMKPACLSVAIYTDADAARKGLKVNTRATALARAAGHPESTTLRGDAFVARTHDDEAADVWSRVDFEPAEAALDAPWLSKAAGANAGRSLSSYSTGGALEALAGGAASASSAVAGGGGDDEMGSAAGAGGDAARPPPGPWAPEPPKAPAGPVRPPTTGVSTANTEWVVVSRVALGGDHSRQQ